MIKTCKTTDKLLIFKLHTHFNNVHFIKTQIFRKMCNILLFKSTQIFPNYPSKHFASILKIASTLFIVLRPKQRNKGPLENSQKSGGQRSCGLSSLFLSSLHLPILVDTLSREDFAAFFAFWRVIKTQKRFFGLSFLWPPLLLI